MEDAGRLVRRFFCHMSSGAVMGIVGAGQWTLAFSGHGLFQCPWHFLWFALSHFAGTHQINWGLTFPRAAEPWQHSLLCSFGLYQPVFAFPLDSTHHTWWN